MSNYETVIGLEVHAQLKTASKMFCACSTAFGAEPNTLICPVCTAQPGTLPVINKEAVAMALTAALALKCTINRESIFARKNYFYPDLPKGYQISQYDRPLAEHGSLTILHNGSEKEIRITRIHMEEDAGKLLHDFDDPNKSHLDLNRCGVPLIEIVGTTDLRSPEEATIYLKTLRSVLMYLAVCDGNMQEGSFRCDANISVRKKGGPLGTRTEIKNLNSFKAIEKAVQYEIDRQGLELDAGRKIFQETRLWNENRGVTSSMRGKEEAHDYRYFPEPDLNPLMIHEKEIEEALRALPELAAEKAKRFVDRYKIPEYDSQVLTVDRALADYFEEAVRHHNDPKRLSNWIMTELLRGLKEKELEITDCKIGPSDLASLVKLIDDGVISGKIAKEVFAEMFATGAGPETIISSKGLTQLSDTREIETLIDSVLRENPAQVGQYKSGKSSLFAFFVGQTMKAAKGKANPGLVNEILRKKLGGEEK